MVIKGCLVRFVTQTHLSFPGQGNTFINGNLCHLYALLLDRKQDGNEFYLCLLLFPNCLQLKIISMPTWHVLERHTLIPFTS